MPDGIVSPLLARQLAEGPMLDGMPAADLYRDTYAEGPMLDGMSQDELFRQSVPRANPYAEGPMLDGLEAERLFRQSRPMGGPEEGPLLDGFDARRLFQEGPSIGPPRAWEEVDQRGPVRMTPSRGYTLGEATLGGARAGAWGGSVAGPPVRGLRALGGPDSLSAPVFNVGPDHPAYLQDHFRTTAGTQNLGNPLGDPSLETIGFGDPIPTRPIPPTDRANWPRGLADRIDEERAVLAHGRATGWDRAAMTDELMKGPSAWLGREYHQGVPIEEVRRMAEQYDRMIPPSRMSRVGSFIKGALTPANIVKDAIGGSILGGASAGLGHLAGRPTSAGQLSLPQGSPLLGAAGDGPVDQATMLRIVEDAAQRKEALRSQYINEINSRFGFGTVGPGARMEEIAQYLPGIAPINR